MTYMGYRLYFFDGDVRPGTANGQGSDGTWFALSASGTSAQIPTTTVMSTSTSTSTSTTAAGSGGGAGY